MDSFSEPEKAGYDDQPVDRAVLVRLQAGVESSRVRRSGHPPRAQQSDLAPGHCTLQQVSTTYSSSEPDKNLVVNLNDEVFNFDRWNDLTHVANADFLPNFSLQSDYLSIN